MPAVTRLVVAAMIVASTLLGALSTAVGSAAAQAEPLGTAALVPDTAIAYFAVNLDLDSGQWTQAEELLARGGFPDAVADIEESITSDLAGGDFDTDEGTPTPFDLDAFLGGEAAVVVTAPALARVEDDFAASLGGESFGSPEATPVAVDLEEQQGGVAAILQPSDPDVAYDQLLQELASTAAGAGAVVEETEYNGVDISYIPSDPESFTTGSALARFDDAILFAEFPADLEAIIDTGTGDANAIDGLAAFGDIRSGLNDEFVAFGFVNAAAVADELGEDFVDAVIALSPGVYDETSFDLYAGFVTWADDPGFRLDSLVRPAEGATLPVVADNFETTLDANVPDDALFFLSAADLGPTGALDSLALTLAQGIVAEFGEGTPVAEEVADLTAMVSPEMVEELFDQAEQIVGFDPRDDLLRQFTGEHAAYLSLSAAADLLTGDVEALFVTDLDDPATVSDSVASLTDLIEQTEGDTAEVSTRDLDGDTVYVVEDSTAIGAPAVEYGVVDEQFLLGVGDGVQAYVDGPPTDALADDEQYQRVLGTLPDQHNQIVYVDLTQVVPLALAALGAFEDSFDSFVVDANPECAEYDTQEEAQAVYDEDIFGNGALDADFDGQACEDFFAPATPEVEATPVPVNPYAAVEAFATVAFENDGTYGTSSILYIAE